MFTVKVRANYSDGEYWLTKWRPLPDHRDPSTPWTFDEISIVTWGVYQIFLWWSRRWHRYIQKIDNEQYGREADRNWGPGAL